MNLRSAVTTFLLLLASTPLAAYYRTAAWIPPWDSAALTSIQQHAGKLDESNPVWYSLSSNGSIVTNWNAENPTWLAAMTGTRVIPTIQNLVNGSFNGTVVENLVSTAASRESHAQAIFNLVVSKSYDGIDIDYESVPTATRANYTAFIQLLGAKLDSAGKHLSVTVYAKTSDAQNWNGPGSQDYVALGAAADSIKLMAYDYHWSTSAAGAITPLTWLDQVTTYAETTIPAAKIMVGLPWYGYDWRGTSGTGVVYQKAMETARLNNATITRDPNNEATYTYSDHVVYFQDAAAFQAKTNLLSEKHPNIGGVTVWRVGGEDPAMWNVMQALRGGTSTPPQNVNPDFTVSGASTISARVAKPTNETYSITRVGGFSDPVNVTVEKITPFDATLTLSQSVLSGTTTSTNLRVTPSRDAALGSYQIRLRFTSGALVKELYVTVNVTKK